MTEYHENAEGTAVVDALHTNGIVSEEFFEDETVINWQTGVSPSILRDIADLAEFCYGHGRKPIDVGFVESPTMTTACRCWFLDALPMSATSWPRHGRTVTLVPTAIEVSDE